MATATTNLFRTMSNYPPGCNQGDIDRTAGLDKHEQCIDCDSVFTSNELDEDGRCPQCRETFCENEYKQQHSC